MSHDGVEHDETSRKSEDDKDLRLLVQEWGAIYEQCRLHWVGILHQAEETEDNSSLSNLGLTGTLPAESWTEQR